MTKPHVTTIAHPLATIWLAREQREDASYYYGGTRLLDPATSDVDAIDMLVRLMRDESAIKNRLINQAIRSGAIGDLGHELPGGFLASTVRAARCVIRPRSPAVTASLTDPAHADHGHVTSDVLEAIGCALNEVEPEIRLTPDFGRFAGLADVLHQYTPNVLGIACDKGGCGGKSSYSVTGVLAGARHSVSQATTAGSVTCIGAAGAMGSQIVAHFLGRETRDLGVCDLAFDKPGADRVPGGCTHLRSRPLSFTSGCLSRGGLIITTAVGDELARSPWHSIPSGTVLLLSQNLALPVGEPGVQLARALAQHGVLVIPGQILTLGGALTARVEWYWRQDRVGSPFDKALAHRVVDRIVSSLTTTVLDTARVSLITPYEAMLHLAGEDE